MNAKKELIDHIEDRNVKYVCVNYFKREIKGTLPEVLPLLDFEYDSGYGGQELFGTVWYTDGTWSERGEYDGSEWWEHKKCPDIQNQTNGESK